MNDVTRVRDLLGSNDDPARVAGVEPSDDRSVDLLLLERILATSPASCPPVDAPRPPRRAAFVAGGVACALALGLTVTSWPRGDGGARAALPIRAAVVSSGAAEDGLTAREVLEKAASAAARDGDLEPTSGIGYRRVIAGYLQVAGGDQPASVIVPETVETWWKPNGSAQIHHAGAAPIWPSAEDRRAWDALGAPVPDTTRTDTIEDLDGNARRFSADPATLASQLRGEIPRGDRTARTLARLRDIRNAGASAALAAATFRVAADLPGVELFGRVTDQLGRSGVAVGIDSDYSGKLMRYELVISDDGQLLEYQQILLESAPFIHTRPPVQIAFEIEVARGVAPAVGSRP